MNPFLATYVYGDNRNWQLTCKESRAVENGHGNHSTFLFVNTAAIVIIVRLVVITAVWTVNIYLSSIV